MPLRPASPLLLAFATHATLLGCQHAAPRQETVRLDGESLVGRIAQPAAPVADLEDAPIESASPPSPRAEVEFATVAGTWAESLIVVTASGPIEHRPLDADRVLVTIPCLVQIDANAAFDWTSRLATLAESEASIARSRLLARAGLPDAEPSRSVRRPTRTRSPELAMSAVDLPNTDDPNRFGLLVVDGDHWGAAVTRHVLDRKTQLDSLLESIDRPRSVRLLGVDRHGRVIHGASLPLMPMAKSRPDRPQALLSPWWIRDRRTHSNDRVVWRNAAQWLAHDRTLARAARELPETVGDILFLPMLGWQSTIIAPPWAVGGLEIDLSIELPRGVAARIDRFEFHLADQERSASTAG